MASAKLVPVEENLEFEQHYVLPHDISAIQVMSAELSHTGLGPVSRLPRGAAVQVCGLGFDKQTIKVAFQGQYYFVFLDDLEALRKPAASAAGAR